MIDKEKELKKLDDWIAALLSGKYLQGRKRLKRSTITEDGVCTTRHCCLGVLCEISQELTYTGDLVKDRLRDADIFDYKALSTYDANNFDPMDTVPTVGYLPYIEDRLDGTLEYFTKYIGSPMLVDKNDSGVAFDAIADYLDTEFRDKFTNYMDKVIAQHDNQ